MIILKTQREKLLEPLQAVIGIVERRHTLPILSNVLIEAQGPELFMTATDLEVQIRTKATLTEAAPNSPALTLSARKLHDILRSLPNESAVALETKDSRLIVRAGKSRFSLQTLPGQDFPKVAESTDKGITLVLAQKTLKALLERVQFAMAQQDVRYYLNGTLLSVNGSMLTVVATDGHRLSYTTEAMTQKYEKTDVILPRKTVSELIKLMGTTDDPVTMTLRPSQAIFSFGHIELLSKVIDGKFPDYTRVIPTNYDKHLTLPRLDLLQALQRAAILSNEKIRGVRLLLTKDSLAIVCSNNEQEEAQDDLDVKYSQDPIDIGFNIAYLLDVLTHLTCETVVCSFGDANSSVLITVPNQNDSFKYVVMPMRI